MKFAYHFFKQCEEMPIPLIIKLLWVTYSWTKLWKVKNVPCHIHLCWWTLHNRLPTRHSIFKKGTHCPLTCPRCDVCRDCLWSKQTWFLSPLRVCFTGCDSLNGWKSTSFQMLPRTLWRWFYLSAVEFGWLETRGVLNMIFIYLHPFPHVYLSFFNYNIPPPSHRYISLIDFFYQLSL